MKKQRQKTGSFAIYALISLSMIFPLTFAPALGQEPSAVLEQTELDPSGLYYVNGRAAKAFQDFNYLLMKVSGDSKIEGYLATLREKRFEYEAVDLAGDKISISTASIGGIRYEFKGRFLHSGAFYRQGKIVKALEGKLSKYQNNKKVAECDLTFDYFTGD